VCVVHGDMEQPELKEKLRSWERFRHTGKNARNPKQSARHGKATHVTQRMYVVEYRTLTNLTKRFTHSTLHSRFFRAGGSEFLYEAVRPTETAKLDEAFWPCFSQWSWVQLGTVGYNMVQPCVLSFRPIRIAVPAHLWRRSNLTIRIDRQKNRARECRICIICVLYMVYICMICHMQYEKQALSTI
jgi:hypothetical protein